MFVTFFVPQAERILAETRTLIGLQTFHSDPQDINILDGLDEGLFAWVTVNVCVSCNSRVTALICWARAILYLHQSSHIFLPTNLNG